MTFILDNSVAFAWCFAEERSPPVMALLDRAEREGACAPHIWPWEAMNGLFIAERRKRITSAERRNLIRFLFGLPLRIDDEPLTTVPFSPFWDEIETLCGRHRLTSYDASYLALALRLGLPLATRDRALIAAAQATGVSLVETL